MPIGEIIGIVDTLIWPLIDRYPTRPHTIHIAGNVYANVHKEANAIPPATEIWGYVSTFTIDNAGNFGAIIDTFLYDTGPVPPSQGGGTMPDIIHIEGNVYAIAFQGVGGDGYLRTITIEDNGQIGTTVIDSLEFDLFICRAPKIRHISGNVYAIAYRGGVGDTGFLITVSISEGVIGAIIDTFNFNAGDTILDILHISGGVHAIVHSNAALAGVITTVNINPTGQIDAVALDAAVFDAVQGREPTIFHIFDGVYAIAYRGVDDDGFLITIPITDTGLIGAIIDTFEFEPLATATLYPEVCQVSTGVYAIVFRVDVATGGRLITISIDNVGNIGAIIDSLVLGANQSTLTIIYAASGIYAISYTQWAGGTSYHSRIRTIDIYGRIASVQTNPATEIT